MLHQKNSSTKSNLFLAACIVVCILALLVMPAHAATNEPNHAINVSALSCMATDGASNAISGYVDFIASSWSTEQGKGENEDILVQYQIETTDGQVSAYHDYMHGKFTEAGYYRFSDMLSIGGNVKRVSLIVTAMAAWGDGVQGGQMTYLEIHPANCDGVTMAPATGEPMHERLWLPIVSANSVRAKKGPPEIGDPVSVFFSTVYLPAISR